VTPERAGVLLCLLSAAGYSTTAILVKFAYEAQVGVVTLLALRYSIGAAMFWLLVARGRPELPAGGALARGVALGMLGTSGQTWLFTSALGRIDAALASLLLYAYPAMVMVAAVLIGRERLSLRRVIALVVASAGIALVLSGAPVGTTDGFGVVLALGAALVYTGYLLVGHALVQRVPPLMLATLICTGAALTFTGIGLIGGLLDFGFRPWGWGPILAIALLPTVLATVTSLAGVTRVGPTVASIITMMEVPVTVLMAAILLGERLSPLQLVGGALVLASVLLLQLRWTGRPKMAGRARGGHDGPARAGGHPRG
jgi:drug/metabolite transporter (DMT)-like permease